MERLKDGCAHLIGTFDRAGRYYINEDFRTSTSMCVRTPSRAWPYSILKHAYTGKYLKALKAEKPEKYRLLVAQGLISC